MNEADSGNYSKWVNVEFLFDRPGYDPQGEKTTVEEAEEESAYDYGAWEIINPRFMLPNGHYLCVVIEQERSKRTRKEKLIEIAEKFRRFCNQYNIFESVDETEDRPNAVVIDARDRFRQLN